jgi:hypothetical protein
MVYFQAKKYQFGQILEEWKMLVYSMAIWYILCPFGNFLIIWYIFPVLVYCTMKNLATLIPDVLFSERSGGIVGNIFLLHEVVLLA